MNSRHFIWALAFPSGGRTTRVMGSDCATREEAETLLFDRNANGGAFDGEFVVKVPVGLASSFRRSAD